MLGCYTPSLGTSHLAWRLLVLSDQTYVLARRLAQGRLAQERLVQESFTPKVSIAPLSTSRASQMDALGQPVVEMIWLFSVSVSVSRVNFLGIGKVVARNGFNMAAGFSLGDFLVLYLEYNFLVINSQVKHRTDKLWRPLNTCHVPNSGHLTHASSMQF